MNISKIKDDQSARDFYKQVLRDLFTKECQSVGFTIDEKRVEEILDMVSFEVLQHSTVQKEATAIRSNNQVTIVKDNLKKFDKEDLLFQTYWVLARLSNGVREFANDDVFIEEISKRVKNAKSPYVNENRLSYGIYGISKLMDIYKLDRIFKRREGRTSKSRLVTGGPLGAEIAYMTDLESGADYAPLEGATVIVAKRWGYKNLKEFLTQNSNDGQKFLESLSDKNLADLCRLGVIYLGICSELEKADYGITKEMIENAFTGLYKGTDFGENSGNGNNGGISIGREAEPER